MPLVETPRPPTSAFRPKERPGHALDNVNMKHEALGIAVAPPYAAVVASKLLGEMATVIAIPLTRDQEEKMGFLNVGKSRKSDVSSISSKFPRPSEDGLIEESSCYRAEGHRSKHEREARETHGAEKSLDRRMTKRPYLGHTSSLLPGSQPTSSTTNQSQSSIFASTHAATGSTQDSSTNLDHSSWSREPSHYQNSQFFSLRPQMGQGVSRHHPRNSNAYERWDSVHQQKQRPFNFPLDGQKSHSSYPQDRERMSLGMQYPNLRFPGDQRQTSNFPFRQDGSMASKLSMQSQDFSSPGRVIGGVAPGANRINRGGGREISEGTPIAPGAPTHAMSKPSNVRGPAVGRQRSGRGGGGKSQSSSGKKNVASGENKKKKKKPQRRKRMFWTTCEESHLRLGVREFGLGKWAKILHKYAHVFKNRTSVDLKDKWRNISKRHPENAERKKVGTNVSRAGKILGTPNSLARNRTEGVGSTGEAIPNQIDNPYQGQFMSSGLQNGMELRRIKSEFKRHRNAKDLQSHLKNNRNGNAGELRDSLLSSHQQEYMSRYRAHQDQVQELHMQRNQIFTPHPAPKRIRYTYGNMG